MVMLLRNGDLSFRYIYWVATCTYLKKQTQLHSVWSCELMENATSLMPPIANISDIMFFAITQYCA